MTNTRKHSSNSNNKTHRNRYRRNRLMKGGNDTNVETPDTNVVTPTETKDENSEANVENSEANVENSEANVETPSILSTISGTLATAADSLQQQFTPSNDTQPPSDVNLNTTTDLEKNVDEIDETHEQLVDALEEAKNKYLELTNALKQKQRAEDTISKILEENPSFLTAIDSDAKSETINSQDTTLTEERDQDDMAEDTNESQGDMDEENTNASQEDMTEESQEDMTEESQGDPTNSFNKGAPEEFDERQSPPLSPREDN